MIVETTTLKKKKKERKESKWLKPEKKYLETPSISQYFIMITINRWFSLEALAHICNNWGISSFCLLIDLAFMNKTVLCWRFVFLFSNSSTIRYLYMIYIRYFNLEFPHRLARTNTGISEQHTLLCKWLGYEAIRETLDSFLWIRAGWFNSTRQRNLVELVSRYLVKLGYQNVGKKRSSTS
jgi:hypothetical protein